MKRVLTGILVFGLLLGSFALGLERDFYAEIDTAIAANAEHLSIDAPFAILIEKETGTVIFEKDADTPTAPASVTKIMTMLLIIEEIIAEGLQMDDMITASANAASKGGSQIFLEEGEQMTVRDLLKSIVVSSANDASAAMAEHIAGSEETFVARMNERAQELGMHNTIFLNSSGLPIVDEDGTERENQTTARDVALMSREVIQHDLIKEFTTIWMDSVRNGEFGLSNTNRLIYHFEGATGLKTGFTQTAMHCLAATAMRDGVEYIAVVLHAESSDARFESAKTLLNFAFANYTLLRIQPDEVLAPIPVALGASDHIQPMLGGADSGSNAILLPQNLAATVTQSVTIDDGVEAPVTAGQTLGTLTVYDGETVIVEVPIIAADAVERVSTGQVFLRFIRLLFTGSR